MAMLPATIVGSTARPAVPGGHVPGTGGDRVEKFSKATRREHVLAEMERIVPWAELRAVVEPHYPKAGARRPPRELEQMLRIHFLQQRFNLCDPGIEEALYDSRCMQVFAGIDLAEQPAPDETTVCRFHHPLARHQLGRRLFQPVHQDLERAAVKVTTGTIVDATLISAPSSTKNREKKRDPGMHSTKKGNQWYFGRKGHFGVDSETKVIHAVAATAANVHDSHCLPDLLHGGERRVWGDSAYQGPAAVIAECAPAAQDLTNRGFLDMAHLQWALSPYLGCPPIPGKSKASAQAVMRGANPQHQGDEHWSTRQR